MSEEPKTILDDDIIRETVTQLVRDALVIWGDLSEDNIARLSGAIHCRYGISREIAQGYLQTAVEQCGLTRQ